MPELLEWLEGTGFGAIARESLYGFQILVAIHILGLIFSVGTLLWVDLRMVGLCLPNHPLTTVYRSLARVFVVGFSVMFLSGATLFAGFATSAYENVFFRIKIIAIALAGINAVTFHVLLTRLPEGANLGSPAAAIRISGGLSILCWGIVILCGRLMSYTLF